jgi:ribokinase
MPCVRLRSVRVAAVGHVEWVTFALVDRVPERGDIVESSGTFDCAAGGAAVAAVQLAKLAGEATLFTAVGDDEEGTRVAADLEPRGVRVRAVTRPLPQRRAVTLLDPGAERTIVTLGERLSPHGADPLPWDELAGMDAIYFVSGDAGAVRRSRRARVVVGATRVLPVLAEAGVELDAVVGSAKDEGERYEEGALDPAPGYVVRTAGAEGGTWTGAEGRTGSWKAAALPGPPVDAYGAGDSFAAGLTFGMGEGRGIDEALELGARCGAACMTGRGPYAGQLRL